MPIAHREKIAGVEGVDGVVGSMWFGGIYKEPSNFFANFAVTADALFENSNFPTKTETEKAFLLSFVSMLGDIQLFITAIITVVVFTIVLMAANTMAMSIRERVRVNVKVLRPDEYLRPEMSVRVTFLERENSGG